MPSFRPGHGLPDFGAAIRTFKDDIDLRPAPIRRDVANVHRQNSDAAGADNRDCLGLDVVVVNVGWHVGSPRHNESKVDFSPSRNLPHMPNIHHQLLRTQRERQHNPSACGFPVTFGFTELNPLSRTPPFAASRFCSGIFRGRCDAASVVTGASSLCRIARRIGMRSTTSTRDSGGDKTANNGDNPQELCRRNLRSDSLPWEKRS